MSFRPSPSVSRHRSLSTRSTLRGLSWNRQTMKRYCNCAQNFKESVPRTVRFVRPLKIILRAVNYVAVDLRGCGGRRAAYHLAGGQVHVLSEVDAVFDSFFILGIFLTSNESVSYGEVENGISLASSVNPLGSQLDRFAESAQKRTNVFLKTTYSPNTFLVRISEGRANGI